MHVEPGRVRTYFKTFFPGGAPPPQTPPESRPPAGTKHIEFPIKNNRFRAGRGRIMSKYQEMHTFSKMSMYEISQNVNLSEIKAPAGAT